MLLFLVADAPTRAGNSPAAQTSALAVEERPSDCHEIVPAVIAFAKVPRRAVVFFECGGRIVDATGTEQSEADTNRRCDASGCRVYEVVFGEDGRSKLRRVRRNPARVPFPPSFVELQPRWGRKGGKLVILSVEEGART
ncbi:MAG: hypothetical protein U0229_23040 [Anaeromyxobacter sp.]